MSFGRTLSAPPLIAFVALAQEVHYSPEERLDVIDAALVATAKNSIDLGCAHGPDSPRRAQRCRAARRRDPDCPRPRASAMIS